MSREIKFRAWCNSWDKMIIPDSEKYSIDIHSSTVWEDSRDGYCDLMQYTGLKDKNGVEIYEGDIIRIKDATQSKGYSNKDVLFDWRGAGIISDDIHIRLDMLSVIAIMGNIHENPELI